MRDSAVLERSESKRLDNPYAKTWDQLRRSDDLFVTACGIGGAEPSKRQYSKWKNNRGKAFKAKEQAIEAMKPKPVVHPTHPEENA